MTMHIFKAAALAALLLAGARCATAHSLPALPDREGYDIKGYIHDGTSGIAGVLVSDGHDFTRTADDGSYYLAAARSAYCVFAVIPSGYEAGTVEQGIPKHFVTIAREATGAVSPGFQADIRLNPIGDDSSFTFLAHADSQPEVYVAPNCWSGMQTAYKDMQQTGAEIAARDGFKPFNLHMGDIVYNTNAFVHDYDRYKDNLLVTGYEIPIFATPGNHDRRYKVDYMEATAFYRNTWGPLWYSFNRGSVHFISMDNVKVIEDGDYTKGVAPEAVAWLKKDLSYVEPGSRVVFFTHQPMTRANSHKKAYKEVLDILTDYNTLILSGHVHRIYNNFPEYHPNIRERNMSQLGGGSWRGPCCFDGTPSGYCIYRVEGDEISWKFKWTGRDADRFMMRMYEPGQFGLPAYAPADEKTILVNIWDYDEDWTVTWTLDGEDMGELPRYDAMKDPWASYNYDDINGEGEERVTDTYHIFHCDVPATGSVVAVTATDAFGRTSTNTLTLQSAPGGVETVDAASSGVARTEVYDLGGVRVFQCEGFPAEETLRLQPGCYIWRLTMTDGSIQTEKRII